MKKGSGIKEKQLEGNIQRGHWKEKKKNNEEKIKRIETELGSPLRTLVERIKKSFKTNYGEEFQETISKIGFFVFFPK